MKVDVERNWKCGSCLLDIHPRFDPCGEPERNGPCPLWWQPATAYQKIMCKIGKCRCPHGPMLCWNCSSVREPTDPTVV